MDGLCFFIVSSAMAPIIQELFAKCLVDEDLRCEYRMFRSEAEDNDTTVEWSSFLSRRSSRD